MAATMPDGEYSLRYTPMQECRVCGCSDDDCLQCYQAQGHPCHWIEDDLCSRCQHEMEIQYAMEATTPPA
jgi:hypothetical protein